LSIVVVNTARSPTSDFESPIHSLDELRTGAQALGGFVADQNGNAGRLYPDLAALRQLLAFHGLVCSFE
jgi:hypothetical protein